jgi:enterochelin esterase family protein
MTQGEFFTTVFRSPKLKGPMVVWGWQSPRTNWHEAVPMLVVNDGIEYIEKTGLIGLLESLVLSGVIPPLRLAALHPVDRDADYKASADYADVVAHELRGWLAFAPTTKFIALGTSLGALAWLHAHRLHPHLFDALCLQSGSYFSSDEEYPDDYDPGHTIRPFVDEVHRARSFERRVPVFMTCGLSEDNLGINRRMAKSLHDQGYPVMLTQTAGEHDWPYWKAALWPALMGSFQ